MIANVFSQRFLINSRLFRLRSVREIDYLKSKHIRLKPRKNVHLYAHKWLFFVRESVLNTIILLKIPHTSILWANRGSWLLLKVYTILNFHACLINPRSLLNQKGRMSPSCCLLRCGFRAKEKLVKIYTKLSLVKYTQKRRFCEYKDQIRSLPGSCRTYKSQVLYWSFAGPEKLFHFGTSALLQARINSRDAVSENINLWEDSITAKLQFFVCYRWNIVSYRLFQQTSLGACIFSVDV